MEQLPVRCYRTMTYMSLSPHCNDLAPVLRFVLAGEPFKQVVARFPARKNRSGGKDFRLNFVSQLDYIDYISQPEKHQPPFQAVRKKAHTPMEMQGVRVTAMPLRLLLAALSLIPSYRQNMQLYTGFWYEY